MDSTVLFLFFTIVYTIIGYFIYGWYSHRSRRDVHFKRLEHEAEKQTAYLRALAETLAPEKLEEIRERERQAKAKTPRAPKK